MSLLNVSLPRSRLATTFLPSFYRGVKIVAGGTPWLNTWSVPILV
jgi:hypothetical protein